MVLLLHLVILVFPFSCKAEVNQTYFQNETLKDANRTSNIWGLKWPDNTNITSYTTVSHSVNQNLYTSQSTKMTTFIQKTAPESTTMTTSKRKMAPESTKTRTSMATYTTAKKPYWLTSQHARNYSTNILPTTPCVCNDDRYKTGIMVCAIIIAVLVLICAVLIICSVALANKVSSLKTKLTQSKRHVRSNGDFLSASSILWPSGMETWQKKSQSANQTMDEISLGEANITEEKHMLMTVQPIDKLKDPNEDKKPSSNDETMTVVSTVEV